MWHKASGTTSTNDLGGADATEVLDAQQNTSDGVSSSHSELVDQQSNVVICSPGNTLRPITYLDMAFLPANDTYWIESVTLTGFLSNGAFVLYSFVISNVMLTKHKCTINLKMNPAEGEAVYYQQNVPFGDIEWSADKTSARFPKGSYFKYDDQNKAFECCVLNDNKTSTAMLFENSDFIKLKFTADVKTGMQVGPSQKEQQKEQQKRSQYLLRKGNQNFFYPPTQHPSNFTFPKQNKFWRQANFPVGSITMARFHGPIDGVDLTTGNDSNGEEQEDNNNNNSIRVTSSGIHKGIGYLGRMTTNVAIHRFITDMRHLKIFSVDRQTSLFMCDMQCTKKYQREKLCLAGLQRNGKMILITQTSDLTLLEEPEEDPQTGYYPPKRYSVKFGGPSLDGLSNINVEMIIAPSKLMERIHILGKKNENGIFLNHIIFWDQINFHISYVNFFLYQHSPLQFL